MTQKIDVPGFGIVEFPDSMNDDQIAAAIKQNMAPQTAVQKEQEPMFSSTGLPAQAMGAFESGLATVSGAIAPIIGVPAGIYGTLASGKFGTQEGIQEGEKLAKQVMNKLTYQPTTAKGQEYTEDIGSMFAASKIPPVMAGPTGIAGLGGMGPKGAFRQGAGYVGDVAGNAKTQTGNVVKGFTGSLGSPENRVIAKPGTEPQVWQKPSALEPATEKYLPPEQRAAWNTGELPTAEAQQAMTAWTPEQQAALQRTKGMVPYAGEKWQGVGEMLAQPFQSWQSALPSAVTNIGIPGLVGGLVGGGPLGAALGVGLKGAMNVAQAIRAGNKVRSAGQLENVGFTPMSVAEREALRTGAPNPNLVNQRNAMFAPPATPQLGYSPTPQAPMPMGGPPRAVNIEGQRSVLPYDINTANSQTARPIAGPITPAVTAQQAAAAKVAPPATPVQAAAQQTVAQRAQQVMGDKYRAPSGFEMDVKPTVEDILAQIRKRAEPVFETPNQAPAAPIDIPSVRAKFADQIEQQRKAMIETRAQNKETYAGTETSLGKEKSQLGMGEKPITADAALKKMIGMAEDIKSYKKNIIVNRAGYDDLALSAGVNLDWATAPDVKGMSVADARKATNKWVYNSIKQQAPELELGLRGPTQQTLYKEAMKDVPQPTAEQQKAMAETAKERNKHLRNIGGRFDMMIDESKLPSTTEVTKQTFKDKNLAIDEALANKLNKNTHDISYRMPGGLTNREIKTPSRLEIVQTDKNGLEVSYITEGTGDAKQYIRRIIDRDGAVLKSETFAEKPINWQRGLLEPLPKPTTTKAEFLQDKMLADLSGEPLNAVYHDGNTTVVVKPLEMFKTLTPSQKKQYVANGGLTSVSQHFDPAGKIDYKHMDKQLKQIQAAINKLD